MNLAGKISIFLAPIVLSVACKGTVISANGGEELKMLYERPVRLFDLSIELLLTGTSVLLGILLYVPAGGSLQKPGSTSTVTPQDLIVCALIQIAAVILIFAFIIGVAHIPFVQANYADFAKIWIPDIVGLFALIWVVVKLA